MKVRKPWLSSTRVSPEVGGRLRATAPARRSARRRRILWRRLEGIVSLGGPEVFHLVQRMFAHQLALARNLLRDFRGTPARVRYALAHLTNSYELFQQERLVHDSVDSRSDD